MVKRPFKGKYLKLEVRVSYDENTDSIHLTSKDKDLQAEQGFHISLNRGRDAEYVLRTLLEKEGLIPKERFRTIPNHADFNDAVATTEWNKFPLGLLANGEEAVWDSSLSPNLLMAGYAGSGKSIIQRNILFHCLRHPEKWAVFGIDLKRVELTPYLKYGTPIMEVATTVTHSSQIINNTYNEMIERYQKMEQNGVDDFQHLHPAPKAWMVMIDQSMMLLSKLPSTTSENKATNLLIEDMKYKINEICKLGRAAGIHLVMATQRADADIFNGFLMANFASRIATGRMDIMGSALLLDNDKATYLNRVKGRGYFQQFGKGSDFQGYYSKFDWPYESGLVSKDE